MRAWDGEEEAGAEGEGRETGKERRRGGSGAVVRSSAEEPGRALRHDATLGVGVTRHATDLGHVDTLAHPGVPRMDSVAPLELFVLTGCGGMGRGESVNECSTRGRAAGLAGAMPAACRSLRFVSI